jgi:hypothetical protein
MLYLFSFKGISSYLGLVLSVGIVYLPILVKYRTEFYNFCPPPDPFRMFEILVCILLSLKKHCVIA